MLSWALLIESFHSEDPAWREQGHTAPATGHHSQGRLTVGAALLGSPHVVGMDIDEAALDTCQRNLDQFEGLQVKSWRRTHSLPPSETPHLKPTFRAVSVAQQFMTLSYCNTEATTLSIALGRTNGRKDCRGSQAKKRAPWSLTVISQHVFANLRLCAHEAKCCAGRPHPVQRAQS